MALRNAFDALMTESMGRKILGAVSYARDINDRLRVTVDSGSVTVSGGPYIAGSGAVGTHRSWYDPNATFMVDQREMMRQQSLAAAAASRQKWTYS